MKKLLSMTAGTLIVTQCLVSFPFVIQPVMADTIFFQDNAENLGLATTGSRASSLLAFGDLTVSPTGEESAFWAYPAPINAASVTIMQANIGDPDGIFISDIVNNTGIFVFADRLFVRINFFSDNDAGLGLGTCVSVGGCGILEDGTVQTAFTITFTDRTDGTGTVLGTDTIQFQSDIESSAVPEPSTWLLVGCSLIGLAISRRFSTA